MLRAAALPGVYSHWMAVVGVVFMACVLFFPAGIWGTLVKRTERAVRS